MPELPDLEVVKEFLSAVLPGDTIVACDVRRPWVVRDMVCQPAGSALIGQQIAAVERMGKFLSVVTVGGTSLVINPKLAGRLAWRDSGASPNAQCVLVLRFSSDHGLHYLDAKDMGQVYICRERALVPGFATQGPDALDPQLTFEAYVARLRPYRGEIKGVLTQQECVAGIGNAYADEILWQAQISPFRKRSALTPTEHNSLYEAMRRTLSDAIDLLRTRVGNQIEVEVRDYLAVHGRGGQPCPRCGQAISELHARQRITSFCRHCQPGTLVRN
jgi:formamidopyrimidine-DNA glycosylase